MQHSITLAMAAPIYGGPEPQTFCLYDFRL